MKQLFVFFLLIFISATSVSAFDDIWNNWYKQSIIELSDDWIVDGFDNNTYLPEDTTTRAEILKIILSAADIESLPPEETCFKDIYTNDWQAKYVCSWAERWITKWYEDGTFRPNGTVTVLEAIAFSSRAFDVDVSSLWEWDVWYEKYQAFMHINNIFPIHKYTVDTLISRGQAAELVNNIRLFSQWESLDYKSVWCEIEPSLVSWSYNIDVAGESRNYLLYVPSGMQKWKDVSLAVAFHGRTNSNQMVRDYMQLWGGRYGYKQNDFIVAYPAGLWNWPYSWSQYENIEFFDAIITQISEKLCVNRDEIFSIGHSLWSYMSNKVSCQRWDVIRAMAWVASDGFRWDCSWPVASLITHLPWDPLASYNWWLRAYSIRSEVNQCGLSETNTSIWDIKSCSQKNSCTPWNTTLFCNSYATYWNDQHSWPKEGSDDILDFFRNINDYS